MDNKYLMLGLSLVFEIVADYFFKRWSLVDKGWMLAAGVLGYTIATVFFAYAVKADSLTKIVCVFTIVNCIAATLIGVSMGEQMTARIAAGILLAIVATWLLQ